MDVICANQHVRGRARLHSVRLDNSQREIWTPRHSWKKNLVLYQWASIVGRLITSGENKYRISGVYLEFENVASPGDPVSVPSYTRTRSIEYYNDLADSSDRDYLRAAISATQLHSSDSDLFPSGNQPVFYAKSSGVAGVHGKPFGYASNSVVFGASLVAFPHETDYTQDLIFSTVYFDPSDQQPKLATSQVGLEWELTLE